MTAFLLWLDFIPKLISGLIEQDPLLLFFVFSFWTLSRLWLGYVEAYHAATPLEDRYVSKALLEIFFLLYYSALFIPQDSRGFFSADVEPECSFL